MQPQGAYTQYYVTRNDTHFPPNPIDIISTKRRNCQPHCNANIVQRIMTFNILYAELLALVGADSFCATHERLTQTLFLVEPVVDEVESFV